MSAVCMAVGERKIFCKTLWNKNYMSADIFSQCKLYASSLITLKHAIMFRSDITLLIPWKDSLREVKFQQHQTGSEK